MIAQIGMQFFVTAFGINIDGIVHTNVEESVLPSGAASAANQSTIIADLNALNSLADSVDTTPTQITKTIAAVATPEALAADGTFFRSAILIGKKSARTANVGIVYLGIGVTNDTQAFEISPSQVININAPPGEKYDLNDWGLDVLNAGDGVIIIYS